MCFIIEILFYYGILQTVIVKLGWCLQTLMGTTTAESVNACASVFLGMVSGAFSFLTRGWPRCFRLHVYGLRTSFIVVLRFANSTDDRREIRFSTKVEWNSRWIFVSPNTIVDMQSGSVHWYTNAIEVQRFSSISIVRLYPSGTFRARHRDQMTRKMYNFRSSFMTLLAQLYFIYSYRLPSLIRLV